MRGQHRALAVGSFGEAGGDNLEGGAGCGGGVALHVRQPDDDGVAAVPRPAPVECLRWFGLIRKGFVRGRVDWSDRYTIRAAMSKGTQFLPPPSGGRNSRKYS